MSDLPMPIVRPTKHIAYGAEPDPSTSETGAMPEPDGETVINYGKEPDPDSPNIPAPELPQHGARIAMSELP